MSQTASSKTSGVVHGKQAFLNRLVLEVRFKNGYLYLDKCGRTVNTIQREQVGWLAIDGQSPKGSSMVDAESKARFNLSSQKYDLSLDGGDSDGRITDEQVERFTNQAEELHRIVEDLLELKEYMRLGFRAWYLFGAATEDEAVQMVGELTGMPTPTRLLEAYQAKVSDITHSFTLACDDRNCRLGFTRVERSADFDLGAVTATIDPRRFPKHSRERLLASLKKRKVEREAFPEFGAMVDFDFYVDDPEEIRVDRFIVESFERMLPQLRKATEKRD